MNPLPEWVTVQWFRYTGISQIQAPVRTDIFVHQGRFSILEKGRSHKGQSLVNKEDVVRLLPSLFAKNCSIGNVWAGLYHVEVRHV